MTRQWRFELRLCCSLVLGLLQLATAEPAADTVKYSGHKIIRVFTSTQPQRYVRNVLDEFQAKVDVWGEGHAHDTGSYVDVRVEPGVYSELTTRLGRANVRFDVQLHDVQRVIDVQARENEELTKRSLSGDPPMMFDRSSSGGLIATYRNHDHINRWLRTLRMKYPNIVELIEIGRSYENRSMLVIRIGLRSSSQKPALWIDGGIHAREWISPATTSYIINTLVTQYKRDADITALVREYDWYILPVMNPDGYEFTFRKDRLWRKTRSPIANSSCIGVDGNRNWDFNWLLGCEEEGDGRCGGQQPCGQTFAGRRPFSEPETAAVSNFILSMRNRWKLYLSLHSYSQIWLTPWGYTREPPTDNDDLMRVANRGVTALQATHGTQYEVGSPAVILYAAAGGSYDWAKGAAGIKYSYTIELRDTGRYGFLLPASQIIPTGEETWAGVLAAIQEIGTDTCWVHGLNCTATA